ncbi:uncharacterized protein LOC114718368 [Neltuma alba]|uniref:uncharacterized protein LOC114718368 n=1 Tax=Neltuma alba TaxID=207710 RepID=UPI0010A4EC46|nr:uncharacterized protein LOC114718368 [Prosopis alba]
MSRSERLKKHGKSNKLSGDKYDEEGVESAARTRPLSLEEILLRRKNKELLEKVKDSAKEAWNVSHGTSENTTDYFESGRGYKCDKTLSSIVEKHALEEPEKLSSRKKAESTSRKEYNLAGAKDRGGYDSETKLCADLSNMGWINKNSKTSREMHSRRKNDGRVIDNSEHEAENKRIRDSTSRDKYLEIDRERSQRKVKKMYRTVDDESPREYKTERNRNEDTYDCGKRKKWSSDHSENVVEKKHHLDIGSKDRHPEGRGKYGRKSKSKYETVDEDKVQDRSAARKHSLGKNPDPEDGEKKEREESVKSHYEEARAKRTWLGRQEHDERTMSLDFSPRAQRRTYDGEHKDLPAHSLKNSSRRSHSDADKGRGATNRSRSHHHRHGGSITGLGGYSPRKRKTEAAVRTPSPSKHSLEKKRAGWDLPPQGTEKSSAFKVSNVTISSAIHNVSAATSVDPVTVKPSVSHLNDSSTGKNTDIDSVQLTQATRPMRRLYLENLPASASEKAVMESLNNLLLSAGVNLIQGAQPCISCILHKDKGQALVEFITAEDASAALSFDGSTIFGSTVKIRRPKDFVEVATDDLERSVDADVTNTISDIVIDSPDKIFIGGISKLLSSEMLMEIAGAFGSLKAYRFGAEDTDEHCAFLEYVDHSVTLKACAGLNGLKLAGKVLTVVQAMPNASPLENDGQPQSYRIPNHAKPLLCKPSEVLKIKDVFATEALSSMSSVEIEEILEDVRLECARFGTVRSIDVVKHSSDQNQAAESEKREAINDMRSNGASQDCECDNKNHGSEMAAYLGADSTTNGVECDHGNKEIREDNSGGGADVDELTDQFSESKSCQVENFGSDASVEGVENKSIPNVMSQECYDHHNIYKGESELLDNMAADDISINVENKSVANSTIVDLSDPNASLGPELDGAKEVRSNEDLSDPNASLGPELDGAKEVRSNENISDPNACLGTDLGVADEVKNNKDEVADHIFEPGCVFVEFRRTEACCKAAYCLHGRFFDGRMVTVEYVALSLYKARFTK